MSENTRVDLRKLAHAVLLDAGFEISISTAAREQLQEIVQMPAVADNEPGIKDLRSLLWTSIDNASSTDLDQIEYVEQLDNDRLRLMVGIADVDHFVSQDTPLDQHAFVNTTSIYTPTEVFPMLPEEISSGKSSLLPTHEKLVTVADIILLPDGTVQSSNFYRAISVNRGRLVYDDVASWLSGGEPLSCDGISKEQLLQQLQLQKQAADRIREAFVRNGALTFETMEINPVMVNGKVVRLEQVMQNSARDIIQHFMILVNNQIVLFLEAHSTPVIYRVVPAPARWDRIVELGARYGYPLPPTPSAKAVSEFLRKCRDTRPAQYQEISLAVLKLIGKGIYSTSTSPVLNEGHFGLALDDYTHSTAPNRRYVDLVLQRQLKSCLVNQPPPYATDRLEVIAEHCTRRESEARRIDRRVKKSAAATVLVNHIGEKYTGIVTAVKSKGTFVRLNNPPVEGRITRYEIGIDVGDKVDVRLIAVDVLHGFIDFELVHGPL